MLVSELMNNSFTVKKLMTQINFVCNSDESQKIAKRLEQKHIKPTLVNIKRYLMICLLTPLKDLPLPERAIIQRSGCPAGYE